MSNSENKIIHYDSDEAAQQVTVTLWKSRDGFLFNDESTARYSGCTHRACPECGEPAEKTYINCKKCRNRLEKERYDELPSRSYNGECVYSEVAQEYFFGEEEIEDHLEENECTLEDLMLVHCETQHIREFEYDDYYSDVFPEDRYLSDIWPELAKLFDAANDLIRKEKRTISWYPEKVRVDISTINLSERS